MEAIAMVYEGNKRCPSYDYMRDSIVIVSEPISGRKNFHKSWCRVQAEALQIISRLTFENQIVLDLMMGSGTTGIVVLKSSNENLWG